MTTSDHQLGLSDSQYSALRSIIDQARNQTQLAGMPFAEALAAAAHQWVYAGQLPPAPSADVSLQFTEHQAMFFLYLVQLGANHCAAPLRRQAHRMREYVESSVWMALEGPSLAPLPELADVLARACEIADGQGKQPFLSCYQMAVEELAAGDVATDQADQASTDQAPPAAAGQADQVAAA